MMLLLMDVCICCALNCMEHSSANVLLAVVLCVVEAKNLPQGTEFNLKHGRDSYVVISLDQEEIFRTATVEQSLT